MFALHETNNYRLEQDQFGFYLLTRKADLVSAYFQGDDAVLWDRSMDAIKVWYAGNALDRAFDYLCSEYL
jgi:hypothetical protein